MPPFSPSAILLDATTPSIGTGQSSGVTDASRLRNPLNKPLLIDEVRFNMGAVSGDNQSGDIRAQLRIGRTPLTNGYVPIWTLGPWYNYWAAGGVGITELNAQLFVWRFPKPLYVPATEFLEPSFYNAGVIGTTAPQTVRVSYACRALPDNYPIPKTVSVPWATGFQGTLQVTGANYTEQTRENHLVNPFNSDLRVQRFVGTLGTLTDTLDYGEAQTIDAGLQYTLVQMVDLNGQFLVRDQVPFGHLFSIKDRAWNVNTVLPPKGFYIAYFTENYSTLTGNGIQVLLSMIGSRDVLLKNVGLQGA